ncbi:MAG: TrmB family transcriptional regulator [Candidatus Helarchaeota archaeon]|nr:TrmB family transcriptional regulator [Candidatus Helarchaeota archaeon]
MSRIEDLEKILERLELTEYERKIYLTLLTSGPLSASEVGDITGIPKFNVYPTLKRLVLKKFVDEQPTSRASKYKAIPPSTFMDELQEALDKRHEKEQTDLKEIATLISKFDLNVEDLRGSSPSDSVWLINSEARIKKSVLNLLKKSEKSITACVPTLDTPIYNQTRQEILILLQSIMKKKKTKMNLILNWELKEGTVDEDFANSISNNGGKIYQWGIGELPFSAFLIDNLEGLIILQSVWIPIPKFGLALWIRHPAYVKPFEKLIQRFNEAGAFKKWG